MDALKPTALNARHLALGAKMTGFYGYAMPLNYGEGVLAEHRWTRDQASLFDVSHMGPATVELLAPGPDPAANHAKISSLLEPLLTADLQGLAPGQVRYTLLLNANGGIDDDLMVARPRDPARQGTLDLVVNAGGKEADFARISAQLGGEARLVRRDAGVLIALQGPAAEAALTPHLPQSAALDFMQAAEWIWRGGPILVSRCGYTGEDGYEILCDPAIGVALWDALLESERVKPAGLAARDSLRLEAGLPLYGHDLDPTVSPLEAGLGFAVSKRRRARGDLLGADRIAQEWAHGPKRLRVGLRLEAGPPAREGAEVFDADANLIGRVTSGGPSPSLGGGVALAFVPPHLAALGTGLLVKVRDRSVAATVVPLPFFPHRYKRSV